MKTIFDMETGDPDDLFTLLLLCDHPRVSLAAITITPGTKEQVGLVKHFLKQFSLDIPVGAFDNQSEKNCVSSWYYKAFDLKPICESAPAGGQVIYDVSDFETTIITGAPLKNFRLAMELGFEANSWFAQGGFAGCNVVPEEYQLEKFKGMRICPTYNFNGDPKAALKMLEYRGVVRKNLISKNVCHGVYYDRQLHGEVEKVKNNRLSLSLIYKGMDYYLSKHPNGKKFHDPLAACCAIDPFIGEWEYVRVYREKGMWGAELDPTSGIDIIVSYDHERFVKTLLGE